MESSRQWSSGICGFADRCDLCAMALVCQCVVVAENVKRMEQKGVSVPVIDACQCGLDKPTSARVFYGLGVAAQVVGNFIATLTGKYACSALSGVQCAAVLFHTELRQEIRKTAKIPSQWGSDHCGDCCDDFVCALFCTSCALTQEQKQLDELKVVNPGQSEQINSMRSEMLGMLTNQQRH